ncbi:MAG: NACHT domain-containing protein [Clostridium sp.]|nr:NACHT domain-containing protein [Clostridium sp.]
MKILFIIALILSALSFAALIITLFRAKKGKETLVREYYVLKCIGLLVSLAVSAITAITAPYSLWDLLADFFHFTAAEPPYLSLIGKLLAFAVFLICCLMINKTYRQWDGPVSRRQYHQSNNPFENSSIFQDFYLAIRSFVEKNNDLKSYHPLPDAAEYQNNQISGEIAWHIEFAKIYKLMSNQAEIHPQNDWHPQQRCFISTYAVFHKIAIYCCSDIPDKKELSSFLSYIRKLHDKYFQIIVAVKNGSQKDYTESIGRIKIEYIFKQNALNHLVDFSEYYRNIKSLYDRPLMNSSLSIGDVYVEPLCHFEKNTQEFSLHPYVSNWLNESGSKQLALLGDFGQGKTLFSISLAHRMIQEKSKRIPILIPLRNKSPRNSTPEEILSYFAIQYGINPEALLILNRNGRLLLIFDGFDEMDLIGNDDIRKRHFKSLWTLAVPNSKLLITGRPNYFLSPDEMKSALGLQTETTNLPYCEGLFLLPFHSEQIMSALRNTSTSVKIGIQKIILENAAPSFLDLISRPSHLFLVSLIWETRELEKKYKNLTSAAIINEFLQDSFERQSAKGQQNPYFYLTPVEREYFMIGIAAKMYKLGITVISYETFHDAVIDLIDLFPEQLSAKNPVFFNLRNGKSVKDFTQSDDNSLLAVINDVRTCGILVNDYANSGLMFAHKSFFDFLAAKFFMGKHLRLRNTTTLITDTLSKNSAFNPVLKNDFTVRKLLAELISSEICRLAPENISNSAKCQKIFEQCQKVMRRFPIYTTPKRLLKSSLKNRRAALYANAGFRTQWKKEGSLSKQRKRLLILLAAGFFAVCACLVRGITLSIQWKGISPYSIAETEQELLYIYELHMNSLRASASSYPDFIPNNVFYFLMPASLFLIYWVSAQLKKLNSKADIILLTWYYACIENHIPESVIYRYFPGDYADEFSAYIKGISLN